MNGLLSRTSSTSVITISWFSIVDRSSCIGTYNNRAEPIRGLQLEYHPFNLPDPRYSHWDSRTTWSGTRLAMYRRTKVASSSLVSAIGGHSGHGYNADCGCAQLAYIYMYRTIVPKLRIMEVWGDRAYRCWRPHVQRCAAANLILEKKCAHCVPSGNVVLIRVRSVDERVKSAL